MFLFLFQKIIDVIKISKIGINIEKNKKIVFDHLIFLIFTLFVIRKIKNKKGISKSICFARKIKGKEKCSKKSNPPVLLKPYSIEET